jgi:hypothetical protein
MVYPPILLAEFFKNCRISYMSTLLKKAYTTAVFSQPLLGELTKEFCT